MGWSHARDVVKKRLPDSDKDVIAVNTTSRFLPISLSSVAILICTTAQSLAQLAERPGFPQFSNPLPGSTNTLDDMQKFPGVRGAPTNIPGATLSGPMRGFPVSEPGSLNPLSPIPLLRNNLLPTLRSPVRSSIGRDASGLGASSTVPSFAPLAPNNLAKSGDNSTDLKILNQRLLNLPEARLPESIFLPGKPSISGTEVPANPELGLFEVVQSIDRSYPPLMIAYQELEVAEGAMVSAAGGFDLAANAAVRNYPLGYYQRFYHEYYLEQPTAYHGVKFFGGYRLGMGQYPIYYWPYRTQAGGEFAAGFEIPLLKGNKIDARRAAVWKAELDRANVDPTIIKQRIDSINTASKAYWDWAANGRKFLIAEELMAKARERNIALARQVELGSMPQVELTDNQRILIQRESLRLSSFRKFQQSSINLSLYLRDPIGLPSIPEAKRIPSTFPDRLQPEFDQLPTSIETALNLRPEMRSLKIKSERIGIDLRLAENEMLPGVNLYMYGSQDVGAQPPSKNLKFFTMESSILVDVPIQRRYAKGRIRSVQGEISQLRQQIGFTRDTITAEVQDSISAQANSFEQVDLLKRSLEVNMALEESERRKYELGNSNILLVNLREQATADAEALVVDAEAEFQRNWADYRAALGLDAVDFNPNAYRELNPEAKRDPSTLRTRLSGDRNAKGLQK